MEQNSDTIEEFNWEFKPPYHKFVAGVLRVTGWYILGICVVLIYTWPYLQKKWKAFKKKRDDYEYDAKYHKNVDLKSDLMIATQLARERMQEKYLRDREIALQKEEERRERKMQELLRLKNDDSSSSQVGDDSSNSSSKSKLKGEYNPLMGDSSRRYVPPKRSRCGKGGCG